MTVVQSVRVIPRRYIDSIALLALTADLAALNGVDDAAVALGTVDGRERLTGRGYSGDEVDNAGPNDLVIALTGTAEACDRAHEAALVLIEPMSPMSPTSAAFGTADAVTISPTRSVDQYFRRGGHADVAVVSVPGRFAAATARVCIDRGLDTMIFSDNVSIDDEITLKDEAAARGVLVMGPDCGTAIIHGVPLGFVNAVRSGRVVVIGASGTGMQEVTSRLHRLGLGVSEAIGCGGRDMTDAVGARTMTAALGRCASMKEVDAVVLVSKPPGDLAMARVIDACAPLLARTVPVVAAFVGIDPELASKRLVATGVVVASSLANAADRVAELLKSSKPIDSKHAEDIGTQPIDSALLVFARQSPTRRLVHGAFCGGTFCREAEHLLASVGIRAARDGGHSLIDFGDDEFTIGRPHPMIDPQLRDARVRWALEQPDTTVVLVDVVLGHGAAPDPIGGLIRIVGPLGGNEDRAIVVAHVCGTDDDPQCRRVIVDRLRHAGVVVADSNADAVAVVARLVKSR